MRSFGEYVQDRRRNSLYYGIKEYAEPDHFMSFKEASWETARGGKSTPTGILAWNILETMPFWVDTEAGKRFEKDSSEQKKAFILKATNIGSEYTNEQFLEDIKTLRSSYDFKPNKKLIKNLEKNNLFEDAEREKNKFKTMVIEATAHLNKPDEMLWEVTMWLAAGKRNPHEHFPDNAPQRWNNILRKLGYDAIAEQYSAIFFDTSAFEVIDEIKY